MKANEHAKEDRPRSRAKPKSDPQPAANPVADPHVIVAADAHRGAGGRIFPLDGDDEPAGEVV